MNATKHDTLFASKEEYLAFKAQWRELARKKELTARDCLMRALLLKQDLDKVMPVTKSAVRLANGAAFDSGRVRAARELRGCDPVLQEARRLQQVAERQAAGRPVPDYLLVPHWSSVWVDTQRPGSHWRGLTVDTFRAAAAAAAQQVQA